MLKGLVLGQLVALVVLAAVLTWVVLPDTVSVEWRGFHFYENPATLEKDVRLWPIAISTSKEQQLPRKQPFFPELRDDYWKDQARQQEIQGLNGRIECLKNARDELSFS